MKIELKFEIEFQRDTPLQQIHDELNVLKRLVDELNKTGRPE